MRAPIAVCACALLIVIGAAAPADAAIWAWGCQGQLGGQQVIFNRYSLVVVDTKQKLGDIHKLRMTEIELPPGTPSHASYAAEDDEGGFLKTMAFTRKDERKRKVTLIEQSSRQISHQHKLICGRDEDTVIYRKVYRYQREEEPARTISMQCLEYQLSTRGGRKGCD
jgi:hypothetical protein